MDAYFFVCVFFYVSLAQKSHTFPLYTAPGTCCTGNVLKVIILCSVESDENFFFFTRK